MPGLTPFQTVGPFLHLGLRDGLGPMTGPGLTTPIVIRGRLIDGAGAGIGDGVLEFWAAGFNGIGRASTDADGGYRLDTCLPSPPHFVVRVLGRGILTEYLTRVYFAEQSTNTQDPILRAVPEDRRATLIATAIGANEYHFDIVVQGERETVFFDV